MKIYVIILSTAFMKGHSKVGRPTDFERKIKEGIKKHTIRANYELWADRISEVKKGKAILSLRQWSGRPYQSKQIEISRITKEDCPSVQRVFITYSGWLGYEASVCGRELFGAIEREALAENDGLTVWDFSEWFFKMGKIDEFSGAIIHFTDFKY